MLLKEPCMVLQSNRGEILRKDHRITPFENLCGQV
jgi:hypothetical protein